MKTYDDYIKLGFDEKAARYFAKGRRKIVKVDPMQDFTLLLTFDNKERRVLRTDLMINHEAVFAPLGDYTVFSRVFLDDCGGVCWDIDPDIDGDEDISNRIDLCPDSCYIDSIPLEEWDTDYTKVTPEEAQSIREAEKSGYVDSDDIDWSSVSVD